MSQYNFSTLNDKDLEELTRDLLNQEYPYAFFQSFKIGKDKGIDLRYSTTKSENEIIVQVKHYLKSGYNALLNTLKNTEKAKIEKLNPKRYIIVTSVALLPTDKEKIKKELSPYILTTNDIFGSDDINGLLAKYPDIEKKHFKLWFSNTEIIQKIVNNGIEGRSAFHIEKIKRNLGIYVVNKSFDDALDILRKQKVLMITGIPGIGKTTLANLITYNLLSRDFRLVYIDEKIREAEDMFDNDPNAKQLFYFDDFLGSNYVKIINSKNSESSIVNFIERIKSTKNKYLILTTRSSILNQAQNSHEKLNRVNLETHKYELEVKNYDDYDKAKILYNHLYYSGIDVEKINIIFQNKNYWKIIKHKNYNPRLIEYFTNAEKTNHLNHNNYFDFIINTLDNPQELWESALNNQLNIVEKLLLFSLLPFGRFVSKDNLEKAFDARIGDEVLNHGFTREINIFNNSLRNLLDGYIQSQKSANTNNNYLDFINPSLRDYLILYFNKNNSEKWRLIESFIFVEQFINIFRPKKEAKNNVSIEDNEIQKFIEIAVSKRVQSINTNDDNNIGIRKAKLFFSYRNNSNTDYIDNFIITCLKEINWDVLRIQIDFLDDILQILEQIDTKSIVFKYFQTNWDSLTEKLIDASYSESILKRIKELFMRFDFDYKKYKRNDANWVEKLKNTLYCIFKTESESIIEEKQEHIHSEEDFDSMEQQVSDYFNELITTYLNDTEVEQKYFPCDDIEKKTLIANNNYTYDKDEDYDDWKYNEPVQDTASMIDGLFTMFER